jgi:hypothetical protein
VLGNRDDVLEGTVGGIEVACTVSDERVRLEVKGLSTGNPVIDNLVRDRQATWAIRIQCARTYYRRARLTTEDRISVDIDGRLLDGKVDVAIFLCAAEDIQGYRPVGLHPDYRDRSFDVRAGDVLALGGHFAFPVDKDFDPLKASAGSLMRVLCGGEETGPFHVELSGDFIEIYLSREDWESWNATKQHAPELLHSAVVVPTLMTALEQRRDFEGARWADRLELLLHRVAEALEPPPSGVLEEAQALLLGPDGRGPLGRGLARFEALLDEGY